MADIGGIFAGLATTGVSILLWGGLIVLVLGLVIGGSIWWYKRSKWGLRLEIKLARNDGKLFFSDKAKGFWDRANGWIVVKRKGFKSVHTRPIDPKKWLQGTNFATLIQVGPEDYIIASEDSYSVVKDVDTGNDYAIMDIVADTGKRKTWKNYTERVAKKAFTITGWLEEHWRAIELAIIIFVMFIGFALLWMRLPSICGTGG
jgi:lipopolysaccharide export LptBFGC system permease protein LptF